MAKRASNGGLAGGVLGTLLVVVAALAVLRFFSDGGTGSAELGAGDGETASGRWEFGGLGTDGGLEAGDLGDGGGGGGVLAADAETVAGALAALDSLPPVPAGAVPSYEREEFLPGGWADLDGDGCYTRNEILARDLEQVTYLADGENCKVATGRLADPYTGTVIEFNREESTQTVQIDHIVALAEAWRAGAWEWTKDQRKAFANDPAELLAVAGAANQSKGDRGPASWLPDANRCGYGAAYANLAARYQLGIAEADREALRNLLKSC